MCGWILVGINIVCVLDGPNNHQYIHKATILYTCTMYLFFIISFPSAKYSTAKFSHYPCFARTLRAT